MLRRTAQLYAHQNASHLIREELEYSVQLEYYLNVTFCGGEYFALGIFDDFF
jgi:hypothetical protein